MDSYLKKPRCLPGVVLVLLSHAIAWAGSHSESIGVLSVMVSAGSIEAPSYTVFSPGVKAATLFRGPVKSSLENNVTFYRTPDIANPANLLGPFSAGVLNSIPANAQALLDENGSVVTINLLDGGSGYLGKPMVWISPPRGENLNASAYRTAIVLADWNSSFGKVTDISVLEKGRGYDLPPIVSVEGGLHYLRIIDPQSSHQGLHFSITRNSDYVLELNNSLDVNSTDGIPSVSEVIVPDLLVEVVQGWTLGSLFGYNTDDLTLHSDPNSSRADWVYLLKQPGNQQGNSTDYVPHFHDGTEWKLVHSPAQSTAHSFISPEESVIIARRADTNVTLSINGTSPPSSTSWILPEFNRTRLVSNPFPTELKLSDLIGQDRITEDNSSTEQNASRWLANPDQDKADNIHLLNSSGWSTYWHDGSNLGITENANISARKGSGLGGALTKNDFSLSSGNIVAISNPSTGNVVVTTAETHGIGNGFWVTISSALGRLTNENKEQINGDGLVVEEGDGLVIESPVNGKWEVTNASTHTFELKDCVNYSDFLTENNQAVWSTGTPGAGYENNVTLSIIGGGGFGARAIGIVDDNGKIGSISLTHGGLFYTQPPTVVVHPGGWRKLGRGNAPINNLTISAGSGALLVRKHPHGVRSLIPLRTILAE